MLRDKEHIKEISAENFRGSRSEVIHLRWLSVRSVWTFSINTPYHLILCLPSSAITSNHFTVDCAGCQKPLLVGYERCRWMRKALDMLKVFSCTNTPNTRYTRGLEKLLNWHKRCFSHCYWWWQMKESLIHYLCMRWEWNQCHTIFHSPRKHMGIFPHFSLRDEIKYINVVLISLQFHYIAYKLVIKILLNVEKIWLLYKVHCIPFVFRNGRTVNHENRFLSYTIFVFYQYQNSINIQNLDPCLKRSGLFSDNTIWHYDESQLTLKELSFLWSRVLVFLISLNW